MSKPIDAYSELITTVKEISLLGSAGSVLSYDEQVFMPKRGAQFRADQSALIARMTHERFTSPRVGELLKAVEGSDLVKDAESDAAANVKYVRRDYDRATKLPTSLVEELTKTGVLGQQAWAEARKASDFKAFQPWLDKMMNLKRQEAKCVGFKAHAYDALLDQYEPDETAAGVKQVFEQLRGPLVELVGKIAASGRPAPMEIMDRRFPVDAQQTFAREAATAFGFDFDAGRLDTSTHPFCSGLGPGDTRMTTRYHEHHFNDAFFGVLHETGHALYEQGLPKEQHFGLPLGESVSLGIHESQSRMWENLVGRSRSFWKHFMPKAREAFPEALKGVSDDDWYRAANGVKPTFIRVEADETTYNLHILIRFEVESALVAGNMNVGDVQGAWNERYKKYLGITPEDDAKGCLQDIHWSAGLVGYFPTYTLGNLYSAQFFEQARQDVGDLDSQFARGEFKPLLNWLREKIHRHGKRYSARNLVKRVTGKELSAEPLLKHLRTRAAEVYGV